jgi:hypothetical protein
MSGQLSILDDPTSKLRLKDCADSIQRLARRVAETFHKDGTWPTQTKLHLLKLDEDVSESDFNAFGHSAFAPFYSAGQQQHYWLNLWALYDTGLFENVFTNARAVIDRAFAKIRQDEQPVAFTRDEIAQQLGRSSTDRFVTELEYVFMRSRYAYERTPDDGWRILVHVVEAKKVTPDVEALFLDRPFNGQRHPVGHAVAPTSPRWGEATMPPTKAAPRGVTKKNKNKKVFIVHGHDHAMKDAVARYVGDLGLKPIILHEQASRGRTIAEKLDAHKGVGFAIVLLTPDDIGKRKTSKGKPKDRARQNVILELGIFWGLLGRDKVCALLRGKIERPSDFDSVVYVVYDKTTAWKSDLARELRAAGYKVDPTKG